MPMIQLDGFDQLMEKLRDLPNKFEQDAEDRLDQITESFLNDVRKSIRSGTSPSLEKEWEPISEATKEIRRQRPYKSGSKPLYETGHMLSTLRKEQVSPTEFKIKINAPISAFFGSQYPGREKRSYNVYNDVVPPTIPVTQSMAYFMMREFGIRMSGPSVEIPQRPLFRPLADEYMQKYKDINIMITVE